MEVFSGTMRRLRWFFRRDCDYGLLNHRSLHLVEEDYGSLLGTREDYSGLFREFVIAVFKTTVVSVHLFYFFPILYNLPLSVTA